jgi:hypothetical protein
MNVTSSIEWSYNLIKNDFLFILPLQAVNRVSFETSFDSKQLKLEPKLVSALSETKHLFRLFQFYTETESFDVAIELKQTGDPPKQFKREYILVFFRKFRVVVSVCFGLLRNSSVCFGCFDIVSKHQNKPKQTKIFCFGFHRTNPKQILFRFVSDRTEIYFCFVSRTP